MAEFKFYVFQIAPEHNAETWWDAGGREAWDEAQKRAGNPDYRPWDALAIPADDPDKTFETFERFARIPGWIDTEPLIITEIETDTPAAAVEKMISLGVTIANLEAKDEDDEE